MRTNHPFILQLVSKNSSLLFMGGLCCRLCAGTQVAALRESKWVYVGNLSFHTSEAQLYSLCTRVGPVRRVIMGLNSRLKTPCGFAFAEFYEANDALEAVAVLSETVLDDMQIRVELDFGYKNGRHFGRGQTGGQVIELKE